MPDASRLTCMAEPRVPAVETDATTAQFIVDALEAGQSCRSAVMWLRDWAAEVSR